jgi:hypothetical protein
MKDSYILTASGRKVSIGNSEVPTLSDIALSLSRMPRFAGHGRTNWTVLEHSLFCYDLARQSDALVYAFPSLPLAMLLHDAHEAITSDIPSPVKSLEMSNWQGVLDLKLMDAYFPGGHAAYALLRDSIKKLDGSALLVEALKVGPESLHTPEDVKTHFGREPRLRDLEVWALRDREPGWLYNSRQFWVDCVFEQQTAAAEHRRVSR